MAIVNTIDSNVTGLRIAEEEPGCIGILPVTPIWVPYEPNSYSDWGGQTTLVARRPINDSRQLKKGVITDLDASGGFNSDLTQTNVQELLQGFFFADLRRKGEEIVTAVDIDTTNPDEYEVALTAGFKVQDLIQGQNFVEAANNAVNVVTAITTDVSVEVADGQLVDEPSPPADAQIVVVGVEGAAGDLDVDVSGAFPAITSTTLDFTTLGLTPGEWIFIGGDTASTSFQVNSGVNNGFARIRSIAANTLTFDKHDNTMETEASTTETIRLFFGRVQRNEQAALQVRRTYQQERQVGDDANGTMSEYLIGGVANELTFNMPSADKLNMDLSFVHTDHETRDGLTGVKSGTRPTLEESDAFNTSSDFSRIKLGTVSQTDENVTPLFAFAEEITMTINNNVSPNKAVGTLGSIDQTAGAFEVSGSLTAYFADVTAVAAVRANSDITIDMAIVKANSGLVLDIPLLALGDGRLNVELDAPIKIPLELSAADATKVDTALDYTAMITWFDYLPNLAAS